MTGSREFAKVVRAAIAEHGGTIGPELATALADIERQPQPRPIRSHSHCRTIGDMCACETEPTA